MLNDDKRQVDEQYTSAIASTNLRVEADRPGDADVIIAAGWSQSRIGSAMLTLLNEWDSRSKPRLFQADEFLSVLKTGTAKERRVRAQAMAHAHNQKLLAGVFDQLRTLRTVRFLVESQLIQWRVVDADMKASSIIRWWLAQACPVCHGTKRPTVEGTNRHGSRICGPCQGTGLRPIPFEEEGKRTANWMDQCVGRAKSMIGSRLF